MMQEVAKAKLSEEAQVAIDQQTHEGVLPRHGNLTAMSVYVKRQTVDGKKVMQETVTNQIDDGKVVKMVRMNHCFASPRQGRLLEPTKRELLNTTR